MILVKKSNWFFQIFYFILYLGFIDRGVQEFIQKFQTYVYTLSFGWVFAIQPDLPILTPIREFQLLKHILQTTEESGKFSAYGCVVRTSLILTSTITIAFIPNTPSPPLNFCKPFVLVKHMRNLVKDYLNVLYVHQNIHNRKNISQHHEYSYLFLEILSL